MQNLRIAAVGAVAIAVLLALAIRARADNASDTPGSIDVGGVTRTYVAHVPKNLGATVPLLLSFHGHFGTGAGQSRLTGLDALSDARGFIVVYPDGLDRGWNDGRALNAKGDDVTFTKALIADFSRRYPIDRKRIYASGFSNGATFTQYLGCRLASDIAAIAPVSGGLLTQDIADCHPSRYLPVIEIGGTSDPIMPYGGGEITLGKIKRGTVLSASQTVAFWAKNAHCTAKPQVRTLAPIAASDGTTISTSNYASCAAGSNVTLYTVAGGGHTWPSGRQYLPERIIGAVSHQLDASQTIVDFLLAHPMRN